MNKLPLVSPQDDAVTEETVRLHRRRAEFFRRAKWLVILVITLFSLTMLLFFRDSINYENFLFLVRDLDAEYNADVDETGIGVTYDADSQMVCRVFKKHLVMVDTTHINLYGLSGYAVFSYAHHYLNPAIAISENYFVVYDLGGYQFAVYNAVGELYQSKIYDYPITDISIAKDGTFAVVTKTDTYCSTVQVFDNRFERVASYNTMRYVTKAILSENAGKILIASVHVQSGVPKTVLQSYPVGSDKESFRLEHPTGDATGGGLFASATIPLDVSYMSGGASAVLCDTGVLFCDADGDLRSFYSYIANLPSSAGDLVTAAFGDDRVALLFRDKVNEGISHLTVLDGRGRPILQAGGFLTVDDGIKMMDYHKGSLMLLSSSHVYRLEKSGKLIAVPLTGTGEVLAFSAYDASVAVICYTDRTSALYFD